MPSFLTPHTSINIVIGHNIVSSRVPTSAAAESAIRRYALYKSTGRGRRILSIRPADIQRSENLIVLDLV